MDSISMETLANGLGKTVKIKRSIIVQNNMRRGKRLGLIQSPDMQFVNGENTWDFFEIVLHIVVVDSLWRALKENETGSSDCLVVSRVH